MNLNIPNIVVQKSLNTASAWLAPSWDVRDFVAVNPFFSMRQKGFYETLSFVGDCTGAELLPDSQYFYKLFKKGEIETKDLLESLEKTRNEIKDEATLKNLKGVSLDDLLNSVSTSREQQAVSVRCLTDQYDIENSAELSHEATCEISRWASAYFDESQAVWEMPFKNSKFFFAWRALAQHDERWKHKQIDLQGVVKKLPIDPLNAIEWMGEQLLEQVGLSEEQLVVYFYRLLSTVRGWASHFKKIEFDAARDGDLSLLRKTGGIENIIAARMAYDVAVLPKLVDLKNFKESLRSHNALLEDSLKRYVWLGAAEIAYRRHLLGNIFPKNFSAQVEELRPTAQMVFCIDVRSEVMRRSIERALPKVQTLGFAGFFGLPISIKGLGHAHGDHQCPVLIKSVLTLSESSSLIGVEEIEKKKFSALSGIGFKKKLQTMPNSCFSFVETLGLGYEFKLIRNASGRHSSNIRFERVGLSKKEYDSVRPDLSALEVSELARLAKGVLKNMGLTQNFAKFVFLFGHGSESSNNPYASGLDCGACAGHSGVGNSRVLADILNRREVRDLLALEGIVIPADTVFASGWHNTSIDLLNVDAPDSSQISDKQEYEDILKGLKSAQALCQNERAKDLSFCKGLQSKQLNSELKMRASDWSELRPEWGLSRNAAFVVGRRDLSRHVDLRGRSFLHDYDHRKDVDLSILELIMTAPMIVTNWINMQYYASTVAPVHFGSGNKVLHNVVGGIGCVQGNASDLLGGLSEQSVRYNGEYFHEPLRLQVIIEAPTESIDRIVQKHEMLQELLSNSWLHLISVDAEERGAKIYSTSGWTRVAITLT